MIQKPGHKYGQKYDQKASKKSGHADIYENLTVPDGRISIKKTEKGICLFGTEICVGASLDRTGGKKQVLGVEILRKNGKQVKNTCEN